MEQVVFDTDGTYQIIERHSIGNFYLIDQNLLDNDNPKFAGTVLEPKEKYNGLS